MTHTEIATPLREFMPGLPAGLMLALYAALLPVAGIFAWLAARRIQRSGTSARELLGALWTRTAQEPGLVARTLWREVVAQSRVRRERLGGWSHSLIFGSMVVLFIGTALVALEEDVTAAWFDIRFLQGNFYLGYEAVLDTATLTLLSGLAIGLFRRYVQRPASLGAPKSVGLVYLALLYFAVSGLVLEALRLLVQQPAWAEWSFAGHALSQLLKPMVGADPLTAYQAVWGAHVVIVFVFLALIPLRMLDHLLVLPANLVLQAGRRPGALSWPFDLREIIEADGDLEGVSQGFANPAELAWRQRFSMDACIDCGRCEAVCPAFAAGRPLSPRLLVQALAADVRDTVPVGNQFDGDVFAREVLEQTTVWSCLTCGACAAECPAFIDQPGTIVELRRHLAEEGRFDSQQLAVLNSLERQNNPLGLPAAQRAAWLDELEVPTFAEHPDVEYLYWLGCMAAYDPRTQSVAKAMIQVLRHAGVSFAVLGKEERCLGETQRKLGDEAGFQMRAMENIELFAGYGIRKIITHCPHCWTTLANDYPRLGGEYEVIHHSVLLAELIEQGLVPAPAESASGTVTFHDPCNLGRLGGEYDAPRAVVKHAAGTSQFVEIGKSRDRAACCGAGGASYFYQVPEERSVSSLRMGQVVETGADEVAVACPFCLNMLEGERGGLSKPPRVRDIAELVAALLPSSR